MDSNLIAMLIRDIALPEIMAVVRAHHNAGLPPPTNEQVLAATELNAGRFIAAGEGFLASLPQPSVPPAVSMPPAVSVSLTPQVP